MQRFLSIVVAGLSVLSAVPVMAAPHTKTTITDDENRVHYRNITVDGIDIFYREAGPKDAPVILLLHGFPSSSQMFRELIPRLAGRYRIVAPDYPGFGHSSMPPREKFSYTFDNIAQIMGKFTKQIGLASYALYIMDYGAPVGFRMAAANPEKITALIVQNGNAYEEGFSASSDMLRTYWKSGSLPDRNAVRTLLTPQLTKWQYTTGVRDVTLLNPDAWTLDQALLDRPGNSEVQLDLLYDYRNNPPLYPKWQAYMRKHQPPTLVAWGKNDELFVAAGGAAYRRDLPDAEIHMLDTGHFALETHATEIASLINEFLGRKLSK